MFKKVVAWKSKKDARDISLNQRSVDSAPESIRSSIFVSESSSTVDQNDQNAAIDAGPLGLNVLYTPDHARKVDIVFVHGLGGSSRWTWSKDRDPHLFWPLTFLPLEPDLCLSRILTFGYDASFRKSTGLATSVLDFAKDLLFDLKYAKDPNLEDLDMGEVPLIFVVHSMGGLIVKEAYMQGQHDPEYEAIIKAVCAITFIATPHRGTNLAQTLNRILDTTVLTNSKQYVADLIKNSPTLQKLNEQFRHIAPKLDIVSFYETQPTSFGIKSARLMVLEKETSVLGYPGEVSKALNADHHSVCKYAGPQDPNYVVMRNILKSLVSKIIAKNNAKSPALSDRRAYVRLRSVLALPDSPNTDYIFFRDRWTEGTCAWINDHEDFKEWRDATDNQPRILWLRGDAATGKSVAASFIINGLVEKGCQCQYFFIRYGDRFKRTISLLLRSLAFQSAQTLPGLMEKMIDLLDEALDFESADYRIIWDRIFKSTIFRLDSSVPIYWVIDGIDESEDPQALVKLILDIPSSLSVSLRILVTSRQSSEIISAFQSSRKHVQLRKIQFEGHIEDLRQHLRAELRISGTDEFRGDLERRIIERSENNFLWVTLAVNKVNQCHISTDVDSVLDDFPTGMEALYDRMASSVTALQSVKPKALAMRIIQCAACALRALSIEELSQALGDDARGILDLPRAIIDLCGGFVVADNDGKVVMIHQTARDYLLDGDVLERTLHIDRQKAHKQLFLDGLRCLMSNNLRSGLARGQKLVFEQYAAEFWSMHLVHATADDEDCAAALQKFLTGRWSLTWIHILALSGQMRRLIQSSKHLSQYTSKRTKQDTKAAILEHELFENWAVDMVRIPGKFGQALRRKPDLIYNFVPPFCPKSSPIYQQFGRKDGLVVIGLSTEKWDDSVARLSTGNAISSTIDATGPIVAILNAMGNLLLLDPSDFRQLPKSPLEHGERVTRLQLNRTATLVATYGYHTLKVWNIKSGQCVLSIPSIESKTRPLAMQFSEDNSTLIVGTDDRRVRSISLIDDEPTWEILSELDEDEIEGQFANSASHMAFSRDGSMAVMDTDAIREIKDLAWHPHHPEVFGLNFEGTLFKWAPYEDTVEEVPTGATKLCISKDGEFLATGDSHGRIKIYATDGFTLLYQLTSQYAVFGLTFSPDSQRLYDVRGYHANAWEPTIMAKLKAFPGTHGGRTSNYDASLSTSMSMTNLMAVDPITSLATRPDAHIVCSGTAKGIVSLHDVRSARVQTIYTSRAKFTINHLVWSDDSRFLCFTDASKQVTVMAIFSVPDKTEWVAEERAVIPVRQWTKQPISQILVHKSSDVLIVCTASQLHAVSMETFGLIKTADIEGSRPHCWTQHPTDESLIVGLDICGLRVFDWTLKELGRYTFIDCAENPSHFDRMDSVLISKVFHSLDKKHLLLHIAHHTKGSYARLVFLDTGEIPTSKTSNKDETSSIRLLPLDTSISSQILNPLSFLPGDRLVFISKAFSVCSVRLSWKKCETNIHFSSGSELQRQSRTKSLMPIAPPQRRRSPGGNKDEVQELFVLPGDWISQDSLSACKVMAKEKSFICPRNGKVTIVRCSALI